MRNPACLLAVLAAGASFGAVPARAEPPTAPLPPRTYSLGDPVPEKRVAVMKLTVTGDHAELVRDWLPLLIEDRLLAAGWTMVVRGTRMEHVQEEHNLPGIKPETRPVPNELLGATALLELTARVKTQDYRGLGGMGGAQHALRD